MNEIVLIGVQLALSILYVIMLVWFDHPIMAAIMGYTVALYVRELVQALARG